MRLITEHLSYREATHSGMAMRHGIDNIPGEIQLKNIELWAINIFEPVRKLLGGHPIYADVFRCEKLNSILPGASKTSQHMALRGAAGDLDNDNSFDGPGNRDIFFAIYNNLEFDQLIWEYGDDNSPSWVHVSYNKGHNRNEVRRKYYRKSKYPIWVPK